MEYYIQQDNKIVLHDTDRSRLENTLRFTPQYVDLPILETEEEIIYLNNEFVFKDDKQEELADLKRQELVNTLYEIKATKAYGGIIINNQLVFETNQISITNTVASLASMSDENIANWKFYTIQGVPTIQQITKAELYGLATFGRAMIDQCFTIEGRFNIELQQATTANLNDETWVEDFIDRAQLAMDQVNNHMTAEFASST